MIAKNGYSDPPTADQIEPLKNRFYLYGNFDLITKKIMANKQIDMRKIKLLFKLYSEGVSKRKISLQLGISRNTVAKYIDFFKRYQFTGYEISAMTLEELDRLFKSDQKPKPEKLVISEKYFPYFDKELRKTKTFLTNTLVILIKTTGR